MIFVTNISKISLRGLLCEPHVCSMFVFWGITWPREEEDVAGCDAAMSYQQDRVELLSGAHTSDEN